MKTDLEEMGKSILFTTTRKQSMEMKNVKIIKVEEIIDELGTYLQNATSDYPPAYKIGRRDIKNWFKNYKIEHNGKK